jgi:hypothetical protein
MFMKGSLIDYFRLIGGVLPEQQCETFVSASTDFEISAISRHASRCR